MQLVLRILIALLLGDLGGMFLGSAVLLGIGLVAAARSTAR